MRNLASVILIFGLLCCTHVSQGKTDITKLQKLVVSTAPDSTKSEAYYKIYDYYKYKNRDSAFYFLEQGYKYFIARNDPKAIANILRYFGKLEMNHGNNGIAKVRFDEAMQIFKSINNHSGIGFVINSYGVMEGQKGNFSEATKYFLTALKEGELGHNASVKYDAYLNLGRVSGEMGDIEQAIAYYKDAQAQINDSSDIRSLCNVYNNLGIQYAKKGDLKTALAFIRKEQALSNLDEYVDVYLYSLLNLSIIYQHYDQPDTALKYLREALAIAEEKKLPIEEAKLLQNIAVIVSDTKPAEAMAILERALVVARKVGDRTVIDDIYSTMIVCQKKLGNYKGAITIMEDEKFILDSLYSIDKAKEIANLLALHDLKQSNNTITDMKLAEQQASIKRNAILVIAAVLLILLAVTTAILRQIKRLNVQLNLRTEELMAANSIKDKVFSIIGHDLRGPLGNIIMVLDYLGTEDVAVEERNEILSSLQALTNSSLGTLDNLLYWGKSQISNYKTETQVFDTYHYVQGVIALLSFTASQKKIAVINNTEQDVKANGDSNHFDFIIRNLLSNAIKFTKENGRIEILQYMDRIPGYLVTAVKDNGIGMDKAALENIFLSFKPGSFGTANEKGTGIGLMLCKEFVELNGGKIWAESEPGKGSTIYFSFPAA